MNLYLIGPRGCGKSAVGKILADKLNWPWVDLDQKIQTKAGTSIAEIFSNLGQGHFRELESQALASLARETAATPHVVSLGGGAVLRPENRRIIEASGVTVLLVAEPKVLVERLLADPATSAQRPALTDPRDPNWSLLEETEHVLALRLPTYQQCANLKLDTSLLSLPEVAQQVLRWLERADPALLQKTHGAQT
ncbi:MAG: shikimate kinase [Planctomycetaceae bacterium]|nr:shikimate kinase [Planctomycetaceae bacterium]